MKKRFLYSTFASVILFFFSLNLFSQDLEQEAKSKFNSKEYREAITLYEKLLDTTSREDKSEFMFYLGLSYENTGDREKGYEYYLGIIRQFPNSSYVFQGFIKAGKYLKDKKDYSAAVKLLNSAPPNDDITKLILECYEAGRDFEKALSVYDQLEAKYKAQYWFAIGKITTLIKLQRINEALSSASNYRLVTPDRGEASKLLAETCRLLQNYDNAAKFYQEGFSITKNSQFIIDEGKMWIDAKQSKKAADAWYKLVTLNGENFAGYELVSNLYQQYFLFNEAIQLYREALKKPGCEAFIYNLIRTLEVLSKYDAALDEYLNLLKNRNYFQYVYDNLIRLAITENRKGVVLDKLVAKLKNTGSDIQVRADINKIMYAVYYKSRDDENALKSAIEVDRLEKTGGSFLISAGDDFVYNDDLVLASSSYNYVMANYPLTENYNVAVMKSGVVYFNAGDTKKAEGYFNQINSSINSYNNEASYYLGMINMQSGNYEKAMQLFKEIEKKHPFAQIKILEILVKERKYAEALEYSKSVQARKDNALFITGTVYLLQLEPPKAIEEFKKLAATFASSDFANEALLRVFLIKNYLSGEQNLSRLKKFVNAQEAEQSGNFRDAVIVYKELIRETKDANLKSFFDMYAATAYIQLKDYDNAVDSLSKVSAKSFIAPDAMELSAYIKFKYKKLYAEALEDYKSIIGRYPDYVRLNVVRSRIEELRKLKK